MKHTECKDCELSSGDCGYHFKIDGKVNYDIVALTACDKYGNCEFFKPKAKPQGDTISRSALKEKLNSRVFPQDYATTLLLGTLNDIIDNVPAVDTYTIEDMQEVRENSLILGAKLAQRPEGEWIISEYVDTRRGFITKCSFCKTDTIGGGNFCPNCGAKMQKGGADNETDN